MREKNVAWAGNELLLSLRDLGVVLSQHSLAYADW